MKKPPRTFTMPELAFYSLIVWCVGMVIAAVTIVERY